MATPALVFTCYFAICEEGAPAAFTYAGFPAKMGGRSGSGVQCHSQACLGSHSSLSWEASNLWLSLALLPLASWLVHAQLKCARIKKKNPTYIRILGAMPKKNCMKVEKLVVVSHYSASSEILERELHPHTQCALHIVVFFLIFVLAVIPKVLHTGGETQ